MRGKLFISPLYHNYLRITPADAGKTVQCWDSAATARDHPRGCGENRAQLFYAHPYVGSPPRMRGKQALNARYAGTVGITPADAGKTNHTSLPHFGHWDHPRGCGENRKARRLSANSRGSPPRMRGKLVAVARNYRETRITPADAGKTISAQTYCRIF